MIYKNDKETTGVCRGTQAISAVYKGARLVWQKLKISIYAWFHDRGWSRDKGWFHS